MNDINMTARAAAILIGKSREEHEVYQAAWRGVHQAISARALSKRKKMKVYEVHHEVEHARMEFYKTVVYAGTAARAAYVAAKSVGLEWALA